MGMPEMTMSVRTIRPLPPLRTEKAARSHLSRSNGPASNSAVGTHRPALLCALTFLILAAVGLVGCSHEAPTTPGSANHAVSGAPACAPPELTVDGEATDRVWKGDIGTADSVGGTVAINPGGSKVLEARIVIGDHQAVADVSQLGVGSKHVLADASVDTNAGTTIVWTTLPIESAQSQTLPVFAVIHYVPSGACGSGDGWVAQTLGTLVIG